MEGKARKLTVPTQPKPQELLRFRKSNQFLTDYAHAKASGRHDGALQELWALLEIIRKREQIPAKYMCHPLKGEWRGWIDCHLGGDFVLIWRYEPVSEGGDVVILAACGTHAYLGL